MDRRSFLLGTATAASAAVAGCSALPGSGGGGDDAGGLGRVGDWLAFGTHPYDVRGDYSVRISHVGRMREQRSALPEGVLASRLEGVVPRDSGLEEGDVEMDVDVFATGEPMPSLYGVTLGEFEREPVVEALSAAGLRRLEDDGEFAILRRDGGEEAWLLVDDGAVVWVRAATSTRGAPAVILETFRGERAGLLEAVDPVAAVADRLPDGFSTRLATDDPDGAPPLDEPELPGLDARGSTTLFDGDTLRGTDVYHFTSADRAAAADVDGEYEVVEERTDLQVVATDQDDQFVEVTLERQS